MNKYLKLVRKIEKKANVRILTCEGEIILSLKFNELSTGELAQISKNSNTSFHNTLKRLVDMGIVEQHKGKTDSRLTINNLSQPMNELLKTLPIIEIDYNTCNNDTHNRQKTAL